jgi:hypothetical protein
MLNQTMQPNRGTGLWFLSAACLIDKLLDRLEGFSRFVLPVQADGLPYRAVADLEARPE